MNGGVVAAGMRRGWPSVPGVIGYNDAAEDPYTAYLHVATDGKATVRTTMLKVQTYVSSAPENFYLAWFSCFEVDDDPFTVQIRDIAGLHEHPVFDTGYIVKTAGINLKVDVNDMIGIWTHGAVSTGLGNAPEVATGPPLVGGAGYWDLTNPDPPVIGSTRVLDTPTFGGVVPWITGFNPA